MTTIHKPRVTLGLPVYNGASYIEAAVASCLKQSFNDIVILISDNCSTDATPEICTQLSAENPKIRWYRNERNLGAAANFNIVAQRADSEFFAWVNHDDLWGDDYIRQAVARLDARADAVLAYPHSAKIDGNGTIVAALTRDLLLNDPTPSQRLRRYHDLFREVDAGGGWAEHEIEGLWIPVYGLIRTEVLQRTRLIGPYIASDTVLLEELLMHGAFDEIPEELFYKRDHEDRSMRAAIPYDARHKWFTGEAPGCLLWPRWRALRERLSAIARAPLSSRERRSCRQEMLAFYVRRPSEGRALVKEVLINTLRLILGPERTTQRFPRW